MRTAEIKGGKPSDVLVNEYKQAVCSFVDREPIPVLPVYMLSEDINPLSRALTQGAGTICHVVSIYTISRITRNTPPQVDIPTCKNISRTELLFYCCAAPSIEVDAAYIVNAFAPDIFAQESDSWYCQRDLAIENIQTYRCLDDMHSRYVVCQARKTSVTLVADREQKKKEEDPRKKPENAR
jgi:hypothetical protein